MLPDKKVVIVGGLPLLDQRTRVFSEAEQVAGNKPVELFPVDANRVVIGGAAELVSKLGVAGVGGASRVDDERRALVA